MTDLSALNRNRSRFDAEIGGQVQPVALRDRRAGRGRKVAIAALALGLALIGCRSGGEREGLREPATGVGPSEGEGTGGDGGAGGDGGTGGAVPDGADGQAGADGSPGRPGGPGGTGGTGTAGGAGGAGGSGGDGGGAPGPAVGAPTDPGAGPARPRGWRKLAASPLRGRHFASAVWTGREMVVWGGAWRAGNASIWLDDGAAYDPAGDRWRRIAKSPLSPRSEAVAAWTGREVLVWGGQKQASLSGFGDEFSDGALYDPAKDTWKYMAQWPLAERYGARAVWTGTHLVVWGGASASAGEDPPPLADGAAYDAATDRWTKMAQSPLGGRIAPLGGARGGSALLAWGPAEVRDGRRVPASDSALYDPARNRWTPTAAVPEPPRQTWCLDPSGCVGADTGSGVVFAGQGLAWDAAGDRWAATATSQFSDPFLGGKAVAWTGSRLLFWGGGTSNAPGDAPPATALAGGATYDPAADRWLPIPAAPLAARARAMAVWTGREFVVWGGEGPENQREQFADGAALTP
jgi:hypothetical protein